MEPKDLPTPTVGQIPAASTATDIAPASPAPELPIPSEDLNQAMQGFSEIPDDEIDDLILRGTINRDIEIFKTLTVTMHTLMASETIKAANRIPSSPVKPNTPLAADYLGQIAILTEAITALTFKHRDGTVKPMNFTSDAQKEQLWKFLSTGPDLLVISLHNEYSKLVAELAVIFTAGIKKN